MEKRVLLAVFLSFLVLFVYQSLFAPPPEPRQEEVTPASEAAGQAGEVAPAPAPATTTGAPPRDEEPTQPPDRAPETLTADSTLRDIVVETERIRAVFSNRGADLRSWRLKNYLDEDGEPLELVPDDVPPEFGQPFDLQLEDPSLTARVAEALFLPSVSALRVRHGDTGTLAFEYRDAEGLYVRKTFEFRPEESPFTVHFSVTVEWNGQSLNPTVLWGPAIGTGRNTSGRSFYQAPRPILFRDGSVERLDEGDLESEPRYEGTFRFAGVEDHYFLSAEVASPERSKVLEFEALQFPGPPGTANGEQQFVSYSLRYAAAPAAGVFFFGPKDFDILQAIDPELVRAVNFGFFAWLAVPLLRALTSINGFIGNYGWSILILTVAINVVIGPLRHKSVVSMRKMQEIQPQVKAIQARYAKLKASDPSKQKMNAELMNLYRERGVNPASGCVPMLLTLPVLFAFYSLLSVAIELRGAPFMLWIRDLSAPDPLYITPVLMGVTQLVQQKMTPSSADPMQQRIMLIMPVMFTVMFLWAPSGLVLYWLTSNLCAIGQQEVTNRIIGPPNVRQERPPAERRAKKVGAGKTERAEKAGGK